MLAPSRPRGATAAIVCLRGQVTGEEVEDKGKQFARVGGSTIGGGTYLGLCKLLTSLQSFEDIAEVEKDGRVASVDLLVRDIYGETRSQARASLFT